MILARYASWAGDHSNYKMAARTHQWQDRSKPIQ